MARICSFNTCEKKHDSHGYCSNHARQYRKYGHPLSREEIKSIRSDASRKTNIKYYKNNPVRATRSWSEEAKARNKGIQKNTGRTHFKKGHGSWNKGTVGLMVAWNKGLAEHTDFEKMTNRQLRLAFRRIRRLVLARDNDTCQVCYAVGDNLQVDHIKPWSSHPELRFEMDNCRTVCMPCHYYVTYKKKLTPGKFWGHRSTTQ